MAVSKYKVIRFLKRYLARGVLICLLCVSSILSLTACCYPTAKTREAEKVQGTNEQDYLNSMFSGAMALTSLSTKELVKDYKFYDEQSIRSFDTSGLNSFYDYADRQYTAMAQYLARALNGIYGDCDPQGEFLWAFEWDASFDVLNPAWYQDDPNACYSNDIWMYYYSTLLNEPNKPSGNSLSGFPLSHYNYMFHYACAGYENLNYEFDGGTTISSLLSVYTNGKNKPYAEANYMDAGYKSHLYDSTGLVQMAPIYVDGAYHYYVMATERYSDGTYQPFIGTKTHLYDVMNANWNSVVDADDNEKVSFFGIPFGKEYSAKVREKRDFFDKFARDDYPSVMEEISDFVGFSYDDNEPNVKNISWEGDHYEYDYGIQFSNSKCNGQYISFYPPIEYNGQSTSKKTYYLQRQEDLVGSTLWGAIKWDDGDWGYVRENNSSGDRVGYYIQGAANTYIILKDVRTANNIPLQYIEFNQAFFPLSNGHKQLVAAVNEQWKTKGIHEIFDKNGTPNYMYDKGKSYMNVTIKDTTDITGVFNHRKYFNSASDKSGVYTMTKWTGYSNSRHTVNKLKYALAAINRYGGYANAKKVKDELNGVNALSDSRLDANTYYYNILGSKSIGLNQFLYDGIMDFIRKDVIGTDLWTKSISAFNKYFDSTGTELYATVFAANANRKELSYYKGYEIVIPRIVGSMFCLINVPCAKGEGNAVPFIDESTRTKVCNNLYQAYTNAVAPDFEYSDLGSTGEAKTLFPSLIASRIYTYGNVSTLNRMYNYQNGKDFKPEDAVETVGADKIIHEDKIGAYKYYTDADGNRYKELKTLKEYLDGVSEDPNYTTGDKDSEGNIIKYTMLEHPGILDVVSEYRIQSLILFPKLTLTAAEKQQIADKKIPEYGKYICVDPTFIMSTIGAGGLINTDTYMRMSTEIAGSYTMQGRAENQQPIMAGGTTVEDNIVYGSGRSYSHDTINSDSATSDANGNAYITAKATKYLHVKGDEFYTDVAVMVVDENGNSVRDKDTNMPLYYKEGEVDKYGELNSGVTPGVTGNGTIKLYKNYTREVYMYTEDYLYFQNGTKSTDANNKFYLYHYEGNSDVRTINTKYFIDKNDPSIAGLDVGKGEKYDPYKLRSNMFIAAPNGWVLNTKDLGAYIKIDFTYWLNQDLNSSANPTIGKLKDLKNDLLSGFVKVDSWGDFWANLKQLFANMEAIFSGEKVMERSFAADVVGTQFEDGVGYELDTNTTGVQLFEISIHVRDCDKKLMLEQGPDDFPIDMHGDYVVTFQASDGTFICAQTYNDLQPNGGGGYKITQTGDFNQKFNESPYADFAITGFVVDTVYYDSMLTLRQTTFRKDITVVVQIDLPSYSLTYNYNQLVFNNTYMSWSAFKSYYQDVLSKATLNKIGMTMNYPDDEGTVYQLDEQVDLGDAFELTGWRVFNGKYTGDNIASYSSTFVSKDAGEFVTLTDSFTVVPVIKLTEVRIRLILNGGEYNTYNDIVELQVNANSSLSSNTTAYNTVVAILNGLTHPEGYEFTGWKMQDEDTGDMIDVTTTEIKNTTFTYDTITYVASWNIDIVNFVSSFMGTGIDSYKNADGSIKAENIPDVIDVQYFNFRNSQLSSPKNKAIIDTLNFDAVAPFVQASNGKYYYFLGYTTKTSFSGSFKAKSSSLADYPVLYTDNAISLTDSYYTSNNIVVPTKYDHLSFADGSRNIFYSLYVGMHTITFNNRGSESSIHIMKGTSFNDNKVVGTIPNINDVNFLGWTTNPNVDDFTEADRGSLISKDAIKTMKFTATQTYYAVYNNAPVTFSDTVNNTSTVKYYLKGAKITDAPAVPTGALGWSLSNTAYEPVDFATYTVSGSVTLYACYKYTITYHYHDMLGDAQTYTLDIYNNSCAQDVSTSNMYMKHWATNPAMDTRADLNTIKLGNYNLYAVYEYVISFTGIQATVGNPTSQTLLVSYSEHSTSITLPINPAYSFETANQIFTFDGWTLDGTTVITGGGYNGITSSLTFIAKYTITDKPDEPPPAG